MLSFETDDLGRDYPRLLSRVLDTGEEARPRGLLVKEVRPLVLGLSEPARCIVARPGFSNALMWLEICQLIAGEFDLGLVRQVSSHAADMMSAQGAYGPRVRDQLRYVIQELEHDPDSRRAVVYVGRETDLRYAQHFEMPCTLTWQFFIRNRRLEMVVNMRSWDLVWGLAYDVPCFTAVQLTLAQCLNCGVGPYTHVAGSGHIYERHFGIEVEPAGARVESCVALPTREGGAVDTWDSTVASARRALFGLRTNFGQSNEYAWRRAAVAWGRTLGKRVT